MLNLLVFVILILPVVSYSRQIYTNDLESGLFLFRAEERSVFKVGSEIGDNLIEMKMRKGNTINERGFLAKEHLSLIFICTSSK